MWDDTYILTVFNKKKTSKFIIWLRNEQSERHVLIKSSEN